MPAVTGQRTRIARDKPFRLFDLPPELWIRVGEFAVTFDQPLCINHQQPRPQDSRVAEIPIRMLQPPPICRANSILRKELLPVYYRDNTFHGANYIDGLVPWLRAIGPDGRKQIGEIFVSSSTPYPSLNRILFIWASDEWDPREEIERMAEVWPAATAISFCCTGVPHRVIFKA